MSTEWVGIDPEGAKAYAALLNTAKDWYQETHNRLITQLNGVTWVGQFANNYRTECETELRQELASVNAKLDNRRSMLLQHVARQEQLSSTGH